MDPAAMAKTGAPEKPSAKYVAIEAKAKRIPIRQGRARTTAVCKVMGTGGRGICILAEMVSAATLPTIHKILRDRFLAAHTSFPKFVFMKKAIIFILSFLGSILPLVTFANAQDQSVRQWFYYEQDMPAITVRRIPESVSKVPATVHLLDERLIEQANIASPTDVAAYTPGFSFNDPFGRYNPAPSMRGLIQPGLGDDPSVGFFNDGLYLSGRSALNSLNFDLQKVEIAKGPQNALYGRNAFGGTVNAVSNVPVAANTAWFDGRLATHDRKQVEAGVNVAISDTLSARFAGYWRDWGGYFDNDNDGGPEIGNEKTQAGRLSLAWRPSSEREVIVRLTHLEDEDGQPKGFLVPANCGPRVGDGQNRLYCGKLPKGPDELEANYVGDNGYDRMHSRAVLEWKETLSSDLTWITLLGGSMEDSVFIRDDDYQTVNASRAGIDTNRFDMQFDTRLHSGSEHSPWQGLAGLALYRYMAHEDRIDQNYVLGDIEPGGPETTTGTDTAGLYGSLTRRWDNGFSLTGDTRLQWEEKTAKTDTLAITSGEPISGRESWVAFTPKLTGAYELQDGTLFYTSVARGYKTGGFNTRENIFDNERTYDPEENITYELGVKNIPVHQTLSVDLGGFYIDWTDQQVIAYSAAGASQNFFLDNAGQTEVYGLEAALRWRPRPNLSFDLGYTYADAHYVSYEDPSLANVQGFTPNGDVSGKQLPRYSPHQVSLTGQYRTDSPLKNWDIVTSGQFSYESSQYTDNAETSKTGVRTLLNLQAGVEKENIYIGLWADNVLDERDPAVGIPWFDASQGFRREYLVVPQDGPTVGVRLKIQW